MQSQSLPLHQAPLPLLLITSSPCILTNLWAPTSTLVPVTSTERCYSIGTKDSKLVRAKTNVAPEQIAPLRDYPMRKKTSRKRGGARKSRGWILGTDLVDDSVPMVLSQRAFALAKLVRKQVNTEAVWKILDLSPRGHDMWDDIINVVVELKRERDWKHTIQMCEWILQTEKFRPDILCYNLLMDAYGRSHRFLETERVFQLMRSSGCLPNEDTFNVLIRAYGNVGLINKAEATFYLMQRFGYHPGIVTFNTLIEALGKGGRVTKAEQAYHAMIEMELKPTANTFTQMINIYGKVQYVISALATKGVSQSFIDRFFQEVLKMNFKNLAGRELSSMLWIIPETSMDYT